MQNICLIIGVICFLLANMSNGIYAFLLVSGFCLWLNNVLFALLRTRRRFIFLFANITFFVFLQGKIYIAFFRSDNFINDIKFSDSSDVWTGLVLLNVALLSLFLGALLTDKFFNLCKKRIDQKSSTMSWQYGNFAGSVRLVSFIMYIVSLLFSFLIGYDKMSFIQTHTYLEYYTLYVSKFPLFVSAIASLKHYFLCFFLATMPSKTTTTVVLLTYFVSTIPDLCVGKRSVTILSLFFALTYYMMRDYYDRGHHIWLGKMEKGLMITIMPFMLMFLAAYKYIRSDIDVEFTPIELVVDFFYSQGVTFTWLCSGLGVYTQLPDGVISYTFGEIIDYFKYSRAAELIWGGVNLGNSNNLLRATLGNSMSHHLSYLLLGNRYLNGNGVGSSYLLEVFVDFGYIGIILFCLLLGWFTIYTLHFARKGIIQCSVILLAINGILYMPRANAMAPFIYLVQIQFLCSFVACFGYSLLLSSFNIYDKLYRLTNCEDKLKKTK